LKLTFFFQQTATRILRKVLNNTSVLYQDDFYKPEEQVPIDSKTQLANWDCPDSVNFEKMANLITFTKSNGGQLPVDYASNEESNVHDGSALISPEALLELERILSPLRDFQFVFVDGFMLYYNDEVLKQLDCKVSFNCSYDTLKSRRDKRQGYHTVEGYWVDPPNYFQKIVWPEYEKLMAFYEERRANENILSINTDENSIEQVAFKIANKLLEEFDLK
jgi:nicotinamide/nicotinate riboside kinase